MSEPLGFVFKARIAPQRLAAYLDAPVAPARQWDDWAQIGGRWVSFDWDNPHDVDRVLDEVDCGYRVHSPRPWTHRDQWARNLKASDYDPGGTFRYTPDGDGPGELTIARAFFGENLPTLIALLAEFRGIASFLSGAAGETASIVRSNVWFGSPEEQEREVQAVVTATEGSSSILSPDSPSWQLLARDARAIFGFDYFGHPDDVENSNDYPPFWPDDSEALRAWTPAGQDVLRGGPGACGAVRPAGLR